MFKKGYLDYGLLNSWFDELKRNNVYVWQGNGQV